MTTAVAVPVNEVVADLTRRAARAIEYAEEAHAAGDRERTEKAMRRYWQRIAQLTFLQQRPVDAHCPECEQGAAWQVEPDFWKGNAVMVCLDHADVWVQGEANTQFAIWSGAGMPEPVQEVAVTDVVVTVPKGMWQEWIAEGDLPGDAAGEYESHFWINGAAALPDMKPGDRVYIVAHGRLRGYAPLVRMERSCRLRPSSACLVRNGGAVAVTIDRPIQGFRGWRYRDWERGEEQPFPAWQTEGVR